MKSCWNLIIRACLETLNAQYATMFQSLVHTITIGSAREKNYRLLNTPYKCHVQTLALLNGIANLLVSPC